MKKPKNPIIIEGFPGFGLVGPIVTEFLINHMDTEMIGEFVYDELPPTTAIHQGKLLHPMAVHYNKKHNLVILHTILNVKGSEWKVAELVQQLAKTLSAKEIISLEGIRSMTPSKGKVYYFGNKKLKECGAEVIKESVIIGVTASLLLRNKNINCLFAETMLDLPDSKAAAEIIKVLDNYLGLKVDYKPLIKQAEEFEKKIKSVLEHSMKSEQDADKKTLSYLG